MAGLARFLWSQAGAMLEDCVNTMGKLCIMLFIQYKHISDKEERGHTGTSILPHLLTFGANQKLHDEYGTLCTWKIPIA